MFQEQVGNLNVGFMDIHFKIKQENIHVFHGKQDVKHECPRKGQFFGKI